MKKVKLFILDLIGITLAIITTTTSVFILRGVPIKNLGEFTVGDILNSEDGLLIYYLTISSVSIGSIAIVAGIIQIVLSFKEKYNLTISIIIWIIAVSALAIVIYGLIKFSDTSFIESIKKTLV